jgi:hypothetical protein
VCLVRRLRHRRFRGQPARSGFDKRTGVKVEKRHAVTARVCRSHYRRFEEQKAKVAAEKKRIRDERKQLQASA